MELRRIEEKDFNQTMQLINETKAYFKSVNSVQWQGEYPCLATIQKDFELNQGYVLVHNNEVIGYGAIILGHDPNYDFIVGSWLQNGPYAVLHRLCIKSDYKGKNLAHYFFEELEKQAKQTNSSLRVDTYHENHSMLRLIEKEGFTYCGVVYMEDHSPRNAYEKVIKI